MWFEGGTIIQIPCVVEINLDEEMEPWLCDMPNGNSLWLLSVHVIECTHKIQTFYQCKTHNLIPHTQAKWVKEYYAEPKLEMSS